ncbi:hypothetical protein [Piscinibacter sp.]|uniref:hypothetical protein n=1 Tax=Piscinibacter sp. TaxID=1903157 RepID=UPI003559E4A3
MKRLLRRDRKDVRVAQPRFVAGRSRPTRALLAALVRSLGQRQLAAVADALGGGGVDAFWQVCERQIDYRARFAKAMERSDAGALDPLLGPPVALPAMAVIEGAAPP